MVSSSFIAKECPYESQIDLAEEVHASSNLVDPSLAIATTRNSLAITAVD
jgi:hypothetical protein